MAPPLQSCTGVPAPPSVLHRCTGSSPSVLRRCTGSSPSVLHRCTGSSPSVLHRCTGSSPSVLHRCTGSSPSVLHRCTGSSPSPDCPWPLLFHSLEVSSFNHGGSASHVGVTYANTAGLGTPTPPDWHPPIKAF
ncbi:unnamed protein product [Staurois parvus]|uniref:Uncharacterized protein n=1 Tax=Staurois parvus TaxID=386267 RepID=A0ABN9H8H7_9NEOB|nr:unnamed protein product [Staurois parvus]